MDDENANDEIGTAGIQIIRGANDPGVYVGILNLTVSDVDFIGIGPLVAGDVITAATTPLEDAAGGFFDIPDTVLGVFNAAGVRVSFNDDAGASFGSAIRFLVPSAGNYYLAVSGVGDTLFQGLHSEEGNYVFTISVPAGTNSILDDENANDQIGTAGIQISGGPDPSAYVGSFDLGGSDVDFVGLGSLVAGDVITAVTTPLEDGFFNVPDTLLGVFDAAGVQLTFSDDAGSGFGSAIRFLVPSAGSYFLGVTGFGDSLFQGLHNEQGQYVFTVSVSPSTSTPNPTPTATPTASASPSATPTAIPTATPTAEPTPTPAMCLEPPAACQNRNDCCSKICSGQGQNKTCQPGPTPSATATPTPTPTPPPNVPTASIWGRALLGLFVMAAGARALARRRRM